MQIIFEGCDAAGKKTQSEWTQKELTERDVPANLYSFPRYDTPLGQMMLRHLKKQTIVADTSLTLRQLSEGHLLRREPDNALTFQSWMLADKCDASVSIALQLLGGEFVIADRWAQSAYAYGGSDGLDETWLERIHHCLPEPDVAFYIDLSPEQARVRRPKPRDRYEEDLEKLADVRQRYLSIWKRQPATNPDCQWVVVDGSLPISEVSAVIWNTLTDVNARRFFGFSDDEDEFAVRRDPANDIVVFEHGTTCISEPRADVLAWAKKLKDSKSSRHFICNREVAVNQICCEPESLVELSNRLVGLCAF